MLNTAIREVSDETVTESALLPAYETPPLNPVSEKPDPEIISV